MESLLRDKSLRGQRVFECRNGGYVMFVAKVDFVPDIIMKLARKEIIEGGGSGDEGSSGEVGGNEGDDVGSSGVLAVAIAAFVASRVFAA